MHSAPPSPSLSPRPRAVLSIYDRIGGKAAIALCVERFYERVLADSQLAPFFLDTDMAWLRGSQVDYLCQLFGGPQDYVGASMGAAHAALPITGSDFARIAEHLGATMAALGVDPQVAAEAMGAVAALKPEITHAEPPTAPREEKQRMNPTHKPQPARSLDPLGDATFLRACLDSAPEGLLVTDPELTILYANDRLLSILTAVEDEFTAAFGVGLDQLVGTSLHRLHKDRRCLERLVRSPAALPQATEVALGGVTLEARLSGLYGAGAQPRGFIVSVTDVSARVALAKKDDELARLATMVDSTPINMMLTDPELRISFINTASQRTLARLQSFLPVRVDQIVGQSIDIFHKDPERIRRLLRDPRNLPHHATIQLGPEHLELRVTAIYNAKNEYVGPMITWDIVTDRVAMAQREKAQADQFRELLSRLNDSSHTLASAAEQLTVVSQQMATTANQTAGQAGLVSDSSQQVSRNVQAVSTAVEELGTSVKQIAKNTNDASRVATHAVQVAQSTNATVSKLGDSSAEIGKVIKVITSIAQQTNLLALNATIEAARAGEAGKGFAVVANEVKELAKETAKATEDISQKIEAIQKDTRGAVAAISQIGSIIGQINDMQNTIATAVQEQTATTSEISRNLVEAARGSIEITRNISAVAEAAQSTTAGAADTQKAAQSLSRIALEMQHMVSSESSRGR